jgi:hypothetical protein
MGVDPGRFDDLIDVVAFVKPLVFVAGRECLLPAPDT